VLSSAASAAPRDIAHHIDLAAHFAVGFDYETFRADLRTVYAVTRCLETISEASLPDDLKARHPSIAWKDMLGAGNIYRRDYEDVAEKHVWYAAQIDLSPLRAVVQHAWGAVDLDAPQFGSSAARKRLAGYGPAARCRRW
jgi:uncharacterized protein with HEPN domain